MGRSGPPVVGRKRSHTWGIFGVPEAELQLLPEDMTGMDAIELGCGTAYVSSWMARRGANVVGVDLSEQQLATARRFQAEFDLELELIEGNAEAVDRPDASFDFAINEYGAAIWADPYRWIPEAHHLLRPGGHLVFLGHSPLVMLCSPIDGSIPTTESLERDYFDPYRLDWTDAIDDPGGIELNLPLSKWVSLFNETGFVIEDYLEPRPAEGGSDIHFFATADWAHRWPSEQVWKLRKI